MICPESETKYLKNPKTPEFPTLIKIKRTLHGTHLALHDVKNMGGFMKKTQKYNLLETLTQFGLDPKEWILDSNGKGFFNTLLLVHKEDPQFRLIGEKGRKGWKKLQLLSI